MSRPVARPIASSQLPERASARTASDEITVAKDSLSARPFRISRQALDVIANKLGDYDQATLWFLADVRLATGHQIARRLWGAKSPTDSQARAARRALARLEHWRLIDRLPRRMGGVRGGSSSIVYGLGTAGRRLLATRGFTGRRLQTPGDRYVAHTLAITELVVRLSEATLCGDLDVIELQTEPQCWRGFLGLMGARLVLKPDLYARIGSGAFEDRWWLEVDRATEASGTLLAKAKRYLAYYRAGDEQRDHGIFPRVIWAVPDKHRADQLAMVLRQLQHPAERLFSIWLYEEVVGRLAAEAIQ